MPATATLATSAPRAPSRAAGRSRSRRGELEPPDRERPSADGGDQERQGRADVLERCAGERLRGDVREEDRLGENEERGDDADRRVDAEEKTHRAGAAQEPPVEREHTARLPLDTAAR